MTLEEIEAQEMFHEGTLKADGFDKAIVGISSKGVLIYSISAMLDIMVIDEEMEEIDAIDHLDYNVLNNYVGEYTPIFIYS